MQKYHNEYKNLRNAHVTGINAHIETLDVMIQDIQYLEGLMSEVYYDFSEDEIGKEPKSIQKIWAMGKEITNRFSVGIDIGATAKAYPNIIRDELDKEVLDAMRKVSVTSKLSLVDAYSDAKEKLIKSFGIEGYLGEISICTSYWKRDDRTVYFGDSIDSVECYANEIINNYVKENDECVLFYLDDGCGNRYYEIYYKVNEVK